MAVEEVLESRRVAEESREKKWRGESFLRDFFLGRFRLDLVDPFPETKERPEFAHFYAALKSFLQEKVDPVEIDRTGEYPRHVLEGLAGLGAFGMKIPVEYGGLGLTHPEYVRALHLVGSHDSNVTALLSAHQAIGVPQPLKLFGTDAQKTKYLPRCARGAISAFALTEPAVGSDPARLSTSCELSEDGSHYVLNGTKLWCTNGTLADLLVVMARDVRTKKISCFVVETEWRGVVVEHRCRFMGLKALGNALISFTSPLAFGAYDPIVAHASSPLDQPGTVTVTCTSGSSATITLGQGLQADTGSTDAAPARRMISGTDYLGYDVYSDSGRTTVWGNTAGTGVGHTGTGTSTGLTVYGRVPAGQNVPSGSYADTVVATVTF